MSAHILDILSDLHSRLKELEKGVSIRIPIRVDAIVKADAYCLLGHLKS